MRYKIEELPKDIRIQVENYIEFLMHKYHAERKHAPVSNPRLTAYGVYEGKIHIREDFDHPLDDFQDYM